MANPAMRPRMFDARHARPTRRRDSTIRPMLQVIPYVHVPPSRRTYLRYLRTDDRRRRRALCHGRISIGIGGHVDLAGRRRGRRRARSTSRRRSTRRFRREDEGGARPRTCRRPVRAGAATLYADRQGGRHRPPGTWSASTTCRTSRSEVHARPTRRSATTRFATLAAIADEAKRPASSRSRPGRGLVIESNPLA